MNKNEIDVVDLHNLNSVKTDNEAKIQTDLSSEEMKFYITCI